jgi:succinyl-diaminopimelate desuccinylase
MDTLLEKLVSIRSVCGDNDAGKEIIDFTTSFLEARGLKVERFINHGFHSLYASPTGNKTPKVLLAAHLDVAPAPQELFHLRLKDGNYYGRGVFDMKYAAATYLHIIDDIQNSLNDYDIGIMFTTDEEAYGPYGTGMLVAKGYIPKVCILPDCGENWEIEEFAKGRWFIEITATGISAHGSRPWEGDSAILKLTQLLNEIATLFANGQKPDTDTINIGIIQGGQLINQIADEASAKVDIRTISNESFATKKAAIQEICQRYNAKITLIADESGPLITDLSNPYIQAYTSLVKKEIGVTPRPIRSLGASDARFFGPLGVPCILSSPPGGLRHNDKEWLEEAGYKQFQRVVRKYLDTIAHTHHATKPQEFAVVAD